MLPRHVWRGRDLPNLSWCFGTAECPKEVASGSSQRPAVVTINHETTPSELSLTRANNLSLLSLIPTFTLTSPRYDFWSPKSTERIHSYVFQEHIDSRGIHLHRFNHIVFNQHFHDIIMILSRDIAIMVLRGVIREVTRLLGT